MSILNILIYSLLSRDYLPLWLSSVLVGRPCIDVSYSFEPCVCTMFSYLSFDGNHEKLSSYNVMASLSIRSFRSFVGFTYVVSSLRRFLWVSYFHALEDI